MPMVFGLTLTLTLPTLFLLFFFAFFQVPLRYYIQELVLLG